MPICMIIMKVDIYIPHKTGYLLCHETGSPKKKNLENHIIVSMEHC